MGLLLSNSKVKSLEKFGRASLTQTVGDILSFIFETGFSKTVRFTDNSGKIPFKHRKLAEVVRSKKNISVLICMIN